MIKRQQGLSLIELLVGMVIVGVLVQMALPMYRAYIGKARALELVQTLDSLKTYAEMCINSDSCVANHSSVIKNAGYVDYQVATHYVEYPTDSNPNIGTYTELNQYAINTAPGSPQLSCYALFRKNWSSSNVTSSSVWSNSPLADGCANSRVDRMPYNKNPPLNGLNRGQLLMVKLVRSSYNYGLSNNYSAVIGVYSGCNKTGGGIGLDCGEYSGWTDHVSFELVRAGTYNRNDAATWTWSTTSSCKTYADGALC